MIKVGRNDPCPCGSGRKYKHCCLGKEPRVAPLPETPSDVVLDSPYWYGAHPWGEPRDDAEIDLFFPAYEDESAPETPHEEALILMDGAYEVGGSEGIELAHQAIATSPDCVEAYLFLAEAEAATATEALAYYEQAAAAAERLDPSVGVEPGDVMERIAGNRADYLEARKGIGIALGELGRHEEALARLEAVIALDPDDLSGARFPLLAEYLLADRDADARALIADFPDGVGASAHWEYGRALLSFRAHGDTIFPRRALTDAFAINPHVGSFLSGLDAVPPPTEADDILGLRHEALQAAAWQREAWERTPGALDWLRTVYGAGPQARLDAIEGGDGPSHIVTPIESVAYIHCPLCHTKTKPRRRQVVVTIEPDETLIVRLACRQCERCDLISLLYADLERAVTTALKPHGGLDQRDFVAIGIIDPAVADQRPEGVDDRAWAEQHLRQWREEVRPSLSPTLLTSLLGAEGLGPIDAYAPPNDVIDTPFSLRSW